MKDTLALWEQFQKGKYEVCLSQVTLDEVGECREPKRAVLYEYLSRIQYTKLAITEEVLGKTDLLQYTKNRCRRED